MERKNQKNKWLVSFSIAGLLAWITYSIWFGKTYKEATVFYTEGAQPVVQILEILNYRGEQFKPIFIAFFTLFSLSLLFIIYLYLYTKKFNLSKVPVIILGIAIVGFTGINIVNKLSLFLIVLVIVSILIMISITITANHLYRESDDSEEVGQINGPFKTLEKAQKYTDKKITKLKKANPLSFNMTYSIDLEEGEGYYVNIYIEETNNRGNSDGERNE